MKIAGFFYTEAQVARIFDVNRITVWRWIRAGKFDAQKIGREVLVPKWEVELIKTKEGKRNGKRQISLVSNEKQLE